MMLWNWSEFLLAYAAFAATHYIPVQGSTRARMITAMGRRTYFAAYGTVSLLVLIWLISAAGRAPFVELWPQTAATRWVPQLTMPLAVFLAVAGGGAGYPFTLGGRRDRPSDPQAGGFAAVTRHPLLWALVLWSAAHLPPNGDLAHVLLFGGFAAMALAAMPVFDARARRALSETEGLALFRAAPILSLRVLGHRSWWHRNGLWLVRRLVLSLAVWATLLALHQPVTGVSPLG